MPRNADPGSRADLAQSIHSDRPHTIRSGRCFPRGDWGVSTAAAGGFGLAPLRRGRVPILAGGTRSSQTQPMAGLGPVPSLINAQLGAGRSARSVQYVHALIRTALAKAERWQLVPRNVARLVEAPKVRRTEIHPLTPTEAGLLLASVEGQDRTLYLLALGLGLRQGEALGLRWRDVDLEAGSIEVKHTLQRIAGKVELCDPKTAKSRRSLSVPAPVLASLREQRRRQVAERLAAGDAWQGPDLSDPAGIGYVFATPIGTPLDGSNVLHKFQRQLAAAGLPRQRFHDLRHGCASYLLAAGVPLRIVQEVLGHSQLSTTADIYAHVSPELQREAAERMGSLLSSIETAR